MLVPLLVVLACDRTGLDRAQQAAVAGVGPAELTSAANDDGRDWPTYGRDYSNRRYSPLRAIDTTNVGSLVLRSSFHTGVGPVGSFEASPIVVHGVMYLATPRNRVIAYDLRRRRVLWQFQPPLGEERLCCGSVNRGVAIGHGLVFVGTLDAQLLALDALTGVRRWGVQVADPAAGYSITMAPLVVESLVVVGTAGAEFPTRGHVSAYDAATGRLVWRWRTVPSPEKGGWWGEWRQTATGGGRLPRDVRRERADSAQYPDTWRHGGGSVWTTPAYDPSTHRIFLSIGNPAPGLSGSERPGDNLYTNSIVALDARSGQLAWYNQLLPHDLWDYDAASPPVLADLGTRRLVLHAGKIGWLYALNAHNGTLVRRSEPFVPQSNLLVAPTADSTLIAPGAGGGASWSPLSFSPNTGLAYVVAQHKPMVFTSAPTPPERGNPWPGGSQIPLDDDQWGTLSAIDPATGRIAWQRRTPRPMVGGSLVTAGGVLFAGESDGWFRAYDAATGRELWQYKGGPGVNAPPITFEAGGEQLVAVAAGGNLFISGSRLGDEVLVFGLPPGIQSGDR